MVPTKTLNPLPFRDLEPHRFEDLIRQLIYDYKNWKKLEATGRLGSDDGFDIRGIEARIEEFPDESGEDEAVEDRSEEIEDRIWLIQCKREKIITPKKLLKYLEEVAPADEAKLHGLIFAACCDFSKTSRDVFNRWCLDHHLKEFVVWGAAEIEDLLLQPKNDHILFAFFGISLQIRKRSVTGRLRSIIATKRKIKRVLLDQHQRLVLFRDASDERFPYSQQKSESAKPRDTPVKPALWKLRHIEGQDYRGLKIEWWVHRGYYSSKDETWDAANKINSAIPHEFENPWYSLEMNERDKDLEKKINAAWMELPNDNRGMFMLYAFLPYDEIIAIDEIGDVLEDYNRTPPTVYVSFKNGEIPITGETEAIFRPSELQAQYSTFYPELSKRLKHFPAEFRSLIKARKASSKD